MLLEREALGWGIAQAELHLRRRIESPVGEIAARLGARARGKRRLEEFRRQLDDVVERLAPFVARLLRRRDLGQRNTGLRRQPLHRLGECESLGHHHEVENAAVLAGREIKPGHFLVVDEKRRRFLLVEGRKSLPLTSRLLEPHAPANDLRNRKPRAQLVEKLRRKAHEADLVIRSTSQYRPAPDADGITADCPGYPQGAGGGVRRPSQACPPIFPFALFGTNGCVPSKIGPTNNAREDTMTATHDAAMTRRGVLASAGAGASAAALGGTPSTAQTSAPKTFVLVHGAWHGGWCWRRVADLLQKRGHKVFTPTMTGLGERSHLIDGKVNLATHVGDIVNVIKWESLNGIVLVGHSYGGFIISGVAEEMREAIGSIVFLDAFVPENSDNLAAKASQPVRESIAAAVEKGETVMKPVSAAVFRVNEKDRGWVDAICPPHPLATLTDKITITGARDRLAKKAYIRAKGYPSVPFDGAQERLKADAAWRVYELPCGHDAMVDMPDRLTEILLEVA